MVGSLGHAWSRQPDVEDMITLLDRSGTFEGLSSNDVSLFCGLWHPLVVVSAYHHLLACPLVLQIDDVICELP